MKNKNILFLFVLAFSLYNCVTKNDNNMTDYKYKDKTLSIDERVNDLLSHMTIEEKLAQMVAVNTEVKDLIVAKSDSTFDISKVKTELPNGIGQITRISETKGGQSQTSDKGAEPLTPYENAILSNTLQKYFIEETRLGIPAIFHEESLHGLAAAHATSFPQPIAMAGSFNPELIEKVYALMAKETRLRGAHQVLSPVLDIARDARWGRVEETFGEDPHLTTVIGGAAIRGFQGDANFSDGNHVAATLKHFAAHGQPEGGTNTAPANYSERVLREFHFAPFKNIIENETIYSVMATYHELDGVPGHGNKWLLNDILREEWGFKGFVVSDYFAIREMHYREGVYAHGVARDGKHAAELALKAGVNIELPFPDCYLHIPKLVKEGTVSIERINQLVGEMLYLKFKLGLFDNPYVDAAKAEEFCGTEANRELALEAALESITLLKNKNNIAPLNLNKIKKIAVIGPNANRYLLGGYSGTPNYNSTLLEGIKTQIGNNAEVVYAKGCGITEGGSWAEDHVEFSNAEEDVKLIKEAVKVALNADVIVLAIGGNEQTSREAWGNSHLGDRADLDLIGYQNQLIDALHKTGKPIIALVYNGRPLAFNNLVEKADAIFECWYLGQESGFASAKVLFGEHNPSGKLPITFPRSVGHLPVYYNHKPSARRGYLNGDISPLYPFGFGLSYSQFEIAAIALKDATINNGENFTVKATLTNKGKMDGAEVVQVYIRDVQSSVTRPVKELKAFKKVYLKAGETKQIELTLESKSLAFYDINMDYLVEPGEFEIMVGNSSDDKDLVKVRLTVE
ncbi:MAG: glycoside hydrolase family 3 C-terminal domain-containing protein [Salinivirgaceae bacterium]|jgi:beta-glucosidase|nr:glycoside hydrolase family 3 C-terminal domain-containing protein [Salinivirgaceae bacterium]